jgi:hypothetical protein
MFNEIFGRTSSKEIIVLKIKRRTTGLENPA